MSPLDFLWKEAKGDSSSLVPFLEIALKIHTLWRWNFHYQQVTQSYTTAFASLFGFCADKLNLLGPARTPVKVAAHLILIVSLQVRVKEQYDRTKAAFLALQEALLFNDPIDPLKKPDPLWERVSEQLDPSEKSWVEESSLRLIGGVVRIAQTLFRFLGELFEFLNLSALLLESCSLESYESSWAMASLYVNIGHLTNDTKLLKERIEALQNQLNRWMGIDATYLISLIETGTTTSRNLQIVARGAREVSTAVFQSRAVSTLGWIGRFILQLPVAK